MGAGHREELLEKKVEEQNIDPELEYEIAQRKEKDTKSGPDSRGRMAIFIFFRDTT